jgi:hypothetical protein
VAERIQQQSRPERDASMAYLLRYDQLSVSELKKVASLALARGEGWKIREIRDYAERMSESYRQLSESCEGMSTLADEGKDSYGKTS